MTEKSHCIIISALGDLNEKGEHSDNKNLPTVVYTGLTPIHGSEFIIVFFLRT